MSASDALARAVTSRGDWRTSRPASIVKLYADGRVDVDTGAGVVPAAVLGPYVPRTGAVVELLRRDDSSYLVLGEVRQYNPTTVEVAGAFRAVYAITPAPMVATTITVNASGTKSWREATGWSQDPPYQATYTSANLGYWRGLYFYGSSLAGYRGRRCTSLSIHLHRHNGAGAGGVGAGGPVAQWIGPHVNWDASGAPYFPAGSINVGSLSDGAPIGDFVLPTEWGQGLLDGTYAGLGHLRLTIGRDYSRCKSLGEDGATGRLQIGVA